MGNLTQREKIIGDLLVANQKLINSLFMGDKEKAAKFIATAVKVGGDSKLNAITHASIVDACISVAQMGLNLSPLLAQVYLVPYGKDIQIIVSARGYTAMAARIGWQIKSFVVREGDLFNYEIDGFSDVLSFKRNLDSEIDAFKYAVAMAKSPNGEIFVEVMNKKQVDNARSASKSGTSKDSPWEKWYDQQATKTVIKRLIKKLPIGEEALLEAVSADERVVETGETTPPPSAVVDLNAMMAQGARETTPPPQQPKEEEKTEPVKQQNGFEKFLSDRGMTAEEQTNFKSWLNIQDEEGMKKFLSNGRKKMEEIIGNFYATLEADSVF